MKIGFIGAGKAGFSLGRFFVEGGIHVTGYYSRHEESAREAAFFTRTRAYDTLGAILRDSDALFLTVPDGAISPVFQELESMDISQKQFCHCSGAMTAKEAFLDIDRKGAYGYSIHPLFPISSKKKSYQELQGAFFCIEGIGPHLPEWKERLQSLGAKVQMISGETKIQYHAACAIASNLVCALADESLELLAQCGFSQELALQALAPLMRSNLEHLLAEGPKNALTGPVERCDTETVRKHLECFPDNEGKEMYRAVSRKLTGLAEQKNPNRDYGAMKKLLEEMEA